MQHALIDIHRTLYVVCLRQTIAEKLISKGNSKCFNLKKKKYSQLVLIILALFRDYQALTWPLINNVD